MRHYIIYDANGHEPLCAIALQPFNSDDPLTEFKSMARRMAALTKEAGITSTDLTFKEVNQAEAETAAEIIGIPFQRETCFSPQEAL